MFRAFDLNFDNSRKNRRRLEIARDMLLAVLVKTKKTRILYQAHLSFSQLEKYLKHLLENDLVKYNDDSSYLITPKGKDFLQMYDDCLERCKTIGERINAVRKDWVLLENMCFSNQRNPQHMPMRKEVSRRSK